MPDPFTFSFKAIGTSWTIDLYDNPPIEQTDFIVKSVKRRIEDFDATYSRFRPDSLLSTVASKAGAIVLPPDSEKLFDFYENLFAATGGKVTPLIGDVLVHAGYDADYSLQPKPGTKIALNWADVMAFDYPNLTVTQPTVLDVGAAGKGYLVDLVCELLRANGQFNFVVDAGGDMRHVGSLPQGGLRVGLEHPRDEGQVMGVATLSGQSICCSADNRRRWAGMHHIMDPDSGKSTNEVIAVWVIADDCMTADGLATALFFSPAQLLREQFKFEYVLVRQDMLAESSASIRVELFGAAK